jgi:hypothetical protein
VSEGDDNKIKAVENIAALANGDFSLRIKTGAGALDLELSKGDISELIYLLSQIPAYGADAPTNEISFSDIVPIPAAGIGFAPGQSASEALIVLRVIGLDLAFEVKRSVLGEMAVELSRIATLLAADPTKAN